MHEALIGKGLCRIRVQSRAKRARVEGAPGVIVQGDRVIFPEGMYGAVTGALEKKPRRRREKPEQTKMKF